MAPHVHSFHPKENKADKISKWLISWIAISLGNKTIQPLDLLPTKAEFAFHLGVSLGTMQNVFRFVEDAGYIESKQRVGSYIKLRGNTSIQKLTSKKDFASDSIKKYLKQNNFKPGDRLISGRQLAKELGLSTTTVRAAIAELILQGILEKDKKNIRAHYYLAKLLYSLGETDAAFDEMKKFVSHKKGNTNQEHLKMLFK